MASGVRCLGWGGSEVVVVFGKVLRVLAGLPVWGSKMKVWLVGYTQEGGYADPGIEAVYSSEAEAQRHVASGPERGEELEMMPEPFEVLDKWEPKR